MPAREEPNVDSVQERHTSETPANAFDADGQRMSLPKLREDGRLHWAVSNVKELKNDIAEEKSVDQSPDVESIVRWSYVGFLSKG